MQQQQQNSDISSLAASTHGISAVALYSYERHDDDEIGFEVNDVIMDIEQVGRR